jgi:hypothetical protein
MANFPLLLVSLLFATLALCSDYFPPPVEGVTVLRSRHGNSATLSYKKVRSLLSTDRILADKAQNEVCECSYSGFVHLPASSLSDIGPPEYPVNMFYWFFPARESPETAPFSIWVGGGPGQSAISGAMYENGPCYVGPDGNSTIPNPHSRNNRVNMLYVDQPVGAGYSYTTLVNVTLDQLTGLYTPTDFSKGISFTPNISTIPGTVSNPDLAFTANNSVIAAKTMWHFAQVWFQDFPLYSPEHARISLWTNSVSLDTAISRKFY